ncbi:uncharacterized protein MONBRDRAFT_7790 [Monosiga brevicollis MX1]|uniref:Conserved oligomeric Golgi complex subunit 1 n=1 Tax=Monosiga brevicollis TaxID=81824 RepID=A9UXF1_MONBE|nr:uncharacterized protein MONBRDRAFT_7790 [Monosiga brevicollis MX1]EDQ89834.1 predicted protein [Monosiga brevicollis MX1]|eukprot:XP_001745256.1 hypothetical protein [Monosiga brevicollis MX1]
MATEWDDKANALFQEQSIDEIAAAHGKLVYVQVAPIAGGSSCRRLPRASQASWLLCFFNSIPSRNDINSKKQDLRQMVGQRYRELLQAANDIKDMAATSAQTMAGVQFLQQHCDQLLGTPLPFFNASSEGTKLQHTVPLYALAVQVKLLLKGPEKRNQSALQHFPIIKSSSASLGRMDADIVQHLERVMEQGGVNAERLVSALLAWQCCTQSTPDAALTRFLSLQTQGIVLRAQSALQDATINSRDAMHRISMSVFDAIDILYHVVLRPEDDGETASDVKTAAERCASQLLTGAKVRDYKDFMDVADVASYTWSAERVDNYDYGLVSTESGPGSQNKMDLKTSCSLAAHGLYADVAHALTAFEAQLMAIATESEEIYANKQSDAETILLQLRGESNTADLTQQQAHWHFLHAEALRSVTFAMPILYSCCKNAR